MTTRWLELDDSVEAAYGVAPTTVRHSLTGHPLLSREAMVNLARTMPSHLIEHHLGRDLDLVMPDLGWDILKAPPVEVAENIEHNGTWMVFWHVEEMPEYRALLHEILDPVMASVGSRDGEVRPPEGYIFFSAPGCVTPAHVDPEHNFLLQVLGTKEFVAGAYPDEATRQRTAERYYGGAAHRNLDWLPPRALATQLEPGTGVYSPYLCPHWVNTGADLSISFSATFQTARRQKWGAVHCFNSRLRRVGVSPRPPGHNRALDEGKRVAQALLNRASSVADRGRTGRREHRENEQEAADNPYRIRLR